MSVINLSWDSDGIIDDYAIYRSNAPFNESTLPAPLAIGVTSKSYADFSVVDGLKYYYMVSSNKNGISKYSLLIQCEARIVVYQDVNWYAPVTPTASLSDFSITENGKLYTLNPPVSGGYCKASSDKVRNASNGKYYVELVVIRSTGGLNNVDTSIGLAKSTVDHYKSTGGTYNPGTGGRYQFRVSSGYIQVSGNNGSAPSWSNLAAGGFVTGDVIGLSIEDSAGSTLIKLYKNGTYIGVISTIPSLIDLRVHTTRWLGSSNYVFEVRFPNEILYPQPGFQAW